MISELSDPGFCLDATLALRKDATFGRGEERRARLRMLRAHTILAPEPELLSPFSVGTAGTLWTTMDTDDGH
jgi:hypothetical protein